MNKKNKQSPLSIPSTITMLNPKHYPIAPHKTAANSNSKQQSSYSKLGRQTTRIHEPYQISKIQQHKKQLFPVEQSKNKMKKQARSISSFGRKQVIQCLRDSPMKKGSMNRNQHTTIRSKDRGPFQKITDIFSTTLACESELQLINKSIKKFDYAINTLNQSMQNSQVVRCIEQIRVYVLSLVDHLLQSSQQKLMEYQGKLEALIEDYERRMKEQQKKIRQSVTQSILSGDTDLSQSIFDVKMRSLFTTKIFNQMQKQGINIQGWISNSKLMKNYKEILQKEMYDSENKKNFLETIRVNKQIENQLDLYYKSLKDDRIEGNKKVGASRNQEIGENREQSAEISIESESIGQSAESGKLWGDAQPHNFNTYR